MTPFPRFVHLPSTLVRLHILTSGTKATNFGLDAIFGASNYPETYVLDIGTAA